jgi:azurin
MKDPIRYRFLTLLAAGLLILAACGDGTRTGNPKQFVLTIGAFEHPFRFEPATATVRASDFQEIALRLRNLSPTSQHNWVLVNGSDAVAKALLPFTPAANLPIDRIPEHYSTIVAATQLLVPGMELVVVFKAPIQPGSFTYLCTVPGHYQAGMKGTLTVTE